MHGEGWITKALAGGGIKSAFSVMLQNLKFHEGKICMSPIKTAFSGGREKRENIIWGLTQNAAFELQQIILNI